MAAAVDQPGRSGGPVKVFETYKEAWSVLWSNFWLLLGVLVLGWVINGIGAGFQFAFVPIGAENPPMRDLLLGNGLNLAWSFFVGGPLGFGVAYTFLKASRDEDPELEDMFEGFRTYASAIGAGILTALIVMAGLLLLIIPGIIAAVRLAFVPYLVTDEKLSAMDAIRESWNRTSGHSWRLFGVMLMAIPIVIVGLILLVIGAIPATMWYTAALAVFFHRVTEGEDPVGARPETPTESGPDVTAEPAAGARVEP